MFLERHAHFLTENFLTAKKKQKMLGTSKSELAIGNNALRTRITERQFYRLRVQITEREHERRA